jgi:hypothetical protein
VGCFPLLEGCYLPRQRIMLSGTARTKGLNF